MEFWNYRDEIEIQNGILYKGMKVIIPTVMREEVLNKIHSSHPGRYACMRKAKDLIFLPGMYNDIKEVTLNCHACAEFNTAQQKQPLQTTRIPTTPWSKIAVDMFSFDRKDYLVTVDYYSDYFEVDRLHSTTTRDIVKVLKPHFARHGIPDILISDNTPNLVSEQFLRFAAKCDFHHVTSSPYHSQSNGKAESAVKIAKTLMKKSLRIRSDAYQALLEWRNTPTVGMKSSPIQH